MEDEKTENWDFDFSGYEQEEEEEKLEKGFFGNKVPNILQKKSKFSPGEEEIKQIAELKGMISKASIKIEARNADKAYLWSYYGLLSEYWERFVNICGGKIREAIQERKDKIVKNLTNMDNVTPEIYIQLLELRSRLYEVAQFKHLSFDIIKNRMFGTTKAARGIKE